MSGHPLTAFGFVRLVLVVPVLLAPGGPAAAAVDVEDVRPGLVAVYRDAGRKPVEITLLEPTIAVALKPGEAAHPRLRADGGTIHWRGYVNVLRAGSYRFSARLRGKLRLTLAGKEMLAAEVAGDRPAVKDGPEVRLESGLHPLAAEFTRLPGEARLELSWRSPHFYPEPLPFDHLFHLPAGLPAALAASVRQEHGRFLVEEHNCMGCHRVEDKDQLARGLLPRKGPDLSKVGERVHAGWLYAWLETPHKLRSGTAMPELFGRDEAGRVERYAVAHYLASLGGPLKKAPRPNPMQVTSSRARGRRLFNSIGCVACHQPDGDAGKEAARGRALTGARKNYPLAGLGSKTTPDKLAKYLENPAAVDPSGRMPHMLLRGDEARDLAEFLCAEEKKTVAKDLPEPPTPEQMTAAFKRVDARADELAAFLRLPAAARWDDLGKRLVIDRGCNNCHTIAPGGKGFANMLASATFEEIKAPRAQTRGCLSDEAGKRGKAPWFGLGKDQRQAVRDFLTEGTRGAGSPAPTHAARVALERFNCLACHGRDGRGGLAPQVVEELRRYEKAENSEAVLPPPLTGVGHKLRTGWLRSVLLHGGRARPWMALRMPQFGEAHVGKLPEALAALEGTDPEDKVHQVALTAAKIQAGRRLVGKQVFGCISCHDIAGIPNTGTRGPDLATMNQRVRYDWYRRWLQQAQRVQPGTRMPTVFPEGKSTNETVLGGSPDAQAEAMWAYLSLGPTLPLPEGTEPPHKGIVLTPEGRPILLRTFMPDAGSRALAVGFPGGVATVFDAQRCRLAYAWSGNFLDAAPVWDGRGGTPAHVLGARFWVAPPGCPWGVNDSNEPPDFAALAKDPARGADPGEGKVFQGKPLLHFKGYAVDKEGVPAFHYRIDAEGGGALDVKERPQPLRSTAGVGLARHFALAVPKGQRAWLLAGESGSAPRVLDGKGAATAVDAKTGRAEVPAAGRFLVLPQDGGRAVVLALTAAPKGATWLVQREGNSWKAIVALPPAREAGRVPVDLNVWSLYRDEPALLKELLAGK